MSILATLLVLSSALMHATWNLLAKRSRHPLTFLWLINAAALVIYAPLFAVFLWMHSVPAAGWPFIVATGVIHNIYVVTLAKAYEHGALSVSYPVSRGTGVVLVPLIAVPLLGERVSLIGMLGIIAVIAGIALLHARSLWQLVRPAPAGIVAQSAPVDNRGMLFAVLAGTSIAGYSLVDKSAMAHVHPIIYCYFIFVSLTIGITPYALRRLRGEARHELSVNRLAVIVAGTLVMGTYLIILAAMRIAPVSYIVPLREVSVLFAAALGVILLKEGFGAQRLVAAIVIGAGVISIAAFG
jgi:drug/metabolite transporter (DMT)-like permease